MRNWILVLTFFCLWISTAFHPMAQQFLAYGVILTVGVLHGANDLILLRYLSDNKGLRHSFIRLISYYGGVVLFVLLLFYCYPPLALLSFILISAYHFGEQHLGKKMAKLNHLKYLIYITYGNVILFMIFYFNMNKVISIVLEITGFAISLQLIQGILCGNLLFFVLFLVLYGWKRMPKAHILRELFYLLVLFIVFRTADLLWGFAIYFVLWHSLPSLADQIKLLNGHVNGAGLRRYLKTSWIYWACSILGLAIMYLTFQGNVDFFISILIYFLAAITFPHVIVMSQLEKS